MKLSKFNRYLLAILMSMLVGFVINRAFIVLYKSIKKFGNGEFIDLFFSEALELSLGDVIIYISTYIFIIPLHLLFYKRNRSFLVKFYVPFIIYEIVVLLITNILAYGGLNSLHRIFITSLDYAISYVTWYITYTYFFSSKHEIATMK